MNINGMGPQNVQAQAHQMIKNQNANLAVEDDEPDGLNAIPAAETPKEKTGNGSGVIKNLLDGHYKSVPAMRLYLNHYEKIAAANSEQTDPIVAEGIDNIQGLTEDVQSFLDGQVSSDETAPEAMVLALEGEESPSVPSNIDIFNEAVEQAGQDFINSTNPQTGSLVEDLQNAFAALIAGLTPPEPAVTNEPTVPQETVVPEEPLLPQEPMVPEEPTEPALIAQEEPLAPTPAEQFEEFIAGLTASFNGFLDTLQENLASANTVSLPTAESFARPANNGSAYDKFLEMYTQLPGVPTAPAPTVPAPPPPVEQSGLA